MAGDSKGPGPLTAAEQDALFGALEAQGAFGEDDGDAAPKRAGLGGRIFKWVAEHPKLSLAIAASLSFLGNAENVAAATPGHHAHDGHDHDHKHHTISGDGHNLSLDGNFTQNGITGSPANEIFTIDENALLALGSSPLIIAADSGVDTVRINVDMQGIDLSVSDMFARGGDLVLNVGGNNIHLSGVENIQIGDLVISTERLHNMGQERANGFLEYISAHYELIQRPEIQTVEQAKQAFDKAFEAFDSAEKSNSPHNEVAQAERALDEATRVFKQAIDRNQVLESGIGFPEMIDNTPRDVPHQQAAPAENQGAAVTSPAEQHVHGGGGGAEPTFSAATQERPSGPNVANTAAQETAPAEAPLGAAAAAAPVTQDKPGTFTIPADVVEHIGKHDCKIQVTESKLVVDGQEFDTGGAMKFNVGGRMATTFADSDDPVVAQESLRHLALQINNIAGVLHEAGVGGSEQGASSGAATTVERAASQSASSGRGGR